MPSPNRRARERDRALARLTRLTSLTALAGVFGTVGFGGLAALNYHGSANAADTATQSTTDSFGSAATVPDPAVQATSPPSRSPVPLQPVAPPTRSARHSHVSSGGSG